MRRRIGILLLVLIFAAGLSACGEGGGSGTEAPGPTKTSVVATTPTTDPVATRAATKPQGATVARTDTEVAVFAEPGDPTPTRTLPAKTGFGSARALLVVADRGDWLQVLLPVRPNGSTGWVRAKDVSLRQVDVRIDVDLTARRLTLRQGDRELFSTPVAVGAPDVPTPTGTFFVVDKLATGNASSAYGPFALGLSGHSDVLTEFGGGDGQVGIHGTDDPGSIGRDVSHGCIRVPNHIAEQLNAIVSLGTPVTIR
jgi:lipoprotein-anchoring transpeptidase ErfK/SrfK